LGPRRSNGSFDSFVALQFGERRKTTSEVEIAVRELSDEDELFWAETPLRPPISSRKMPAADER
jgi:hypothetical protein